MFAGVYVNKTMSILKAGSCEALDEANLNVLKSKNITKTTDFISKDPEEISELTGIPYKDAVTIRKIILAQYSALPVVGRELYKSLVETTTILSTGIDSIDIVLDGGLYTGEVTEICGGVAAGKTQLCLNICARALCESSQRVVYIDTGAAFSSKRLIQMLPQTNEVERLLSSVHVYGAHTIYEVFDTLESIRQQLQTGNQGDSVFYSQLKLVILDNVASVVYPLLGAGLFAENQGLLCLLSQKLKALATDYSLAVLVTNNYVKSDDGSRSASLGRMWSHVPHVRLMIAEDGDSEPTHRTVTVTKNCRGENGNSASFTMATDGPIS